MGSGGFTWWIARAGQNGSRSTLIESRLFLPDLITGHEPENRKWLETNGTIIGFPGGEMGRAAALPYWGRPPVGRRCCAAGWFSAGSKITPWFMGRSELKGGA
jgi:hypothetical protein